MYPVDLVTELSRAPCAIRMPDQIWDGVIEPGGYERVLSCRYAYTAKGIRYYRCELVGYRLILTENQDYDIITLPAG